MLSENLPKLGTRKKSWLCVLVYAVVCAYVYVYIILLFSYNLCHFRLGISKLAVKSSMHKWQATFKQNKMSFFNQ